MFKATRNLNNKLISHNCHIKYPNGVILNDAERVCERLQEYCKQLYAEDLSIQAVNDTQDMEGNEADIILSKIENVM